MNRQEALKIIRRNKFGLNPPEGIVYRDEIAAYNEALEFLGQPPTLEDFLGWEEGVEYKCLSGRYKVVNGELLHYCSVTQDYKPAKIYLNRSNILTMREAEKVEHKKKYRVPLPNLITTDGMQQYLTEKKGYWFASRLNENLKQEWTEGELCNIPIIYRSYPRETVK